MNRKSPFEEKTTQQVQQFWDQRPCNVRHSPQGIGTRLYFDEVESRKYLVEPHIPRFAQFSRWKDKKVLEIGCGIGTDTINFAISGAQVSAVELSRKSLEIARRRAEVFGLEERIDFYLGDAERLSEFVPQESYDLIYSFGVIHHTPHPERVLEEIRNYAKPEGEIKIMVYNHRSYKVLWIILKYGKGRFWKTREIVAENSEAATGSPVSYTYTQKKIKRLLEQHGFEVTELWVDHIFPYRVGDYLKYKYVKAWWIRLLPDSVFRWLEHRFGWHICVTARIPEAVCTSPQ